MSKSVWNLLAKVRQAKADFIAGREADCLAIAFDQIALVKYRIQTTGKDSTNAQFEAYTDAYKKTRARDGFQTQYFDATRTGRTWASIRPRIQSSNLFSCTVVIEASDELSGKILKGLSFKRGNILQPTDAELVIIKAANRERIKKYFKFNL